VPVHELCIALLARVEKAVLVAFTDPIPKAFAKTELVVKIFGLDEDVSIKQEARQSDQSLGSGCLFAAYKARPLSLV
jgi:hypothetical protein